MSSKSCNLQHSPNLGGSGETQSHRTHFHILILREGKDSRPSSRRKNKYKQPPALTDLAFCHVLERGGFRCVLFYRDEGFSVCPAEGSIPTASLLGKIWQKARGAHCPALPCLPWAALARCYWSESRTDNLSPTPLAKNKLYIYVYKKKATNENQSSDAPLP